MTTTARDTLNEPWIQVVKEWVYSGQCPEFCSVGRGYRPIVIHAVEAFQEWIEERSS